MKHKLTPKQKRFIEEYLVDLNGTQAAIRAGYSAKTANRIATENLSKPVIANEIQKEQQKRSKRTEIEQDRVLQEEARLAFSDIRQIFNKDGCLIQPHLLPEDIARSVSGIDVITTTTKDGDTTTTYKYRFWDKGSALQRVEKHLGMTGADLSISVDVPGVNVIVKPNSVDYGGNRARGTSSKAK